ncbi:AGAP011348-PA-like protein [Anopheles sinensis]|uniref:AGAP011348-PA-like protein n=1 Tax=Anopheles sinensis TaxID=74873 RepID=A0A084VHY0_ANOSI|nr:AGAP011348-PA-like protein [Anopheles sinensis]
MGRCRVVSEQWIHVSDWLPTLGFAAGITDGISQGSPIDGQNQWDTLLSESAGGRTVVMNNADEKFSYSSYMKNGWKYVNGSTFNGVFDGWLGLLSENDDLSTEEYYSWLTAPGTIGESIGLSRDRVETLRSSATLACPTDLQETLCKPLEKPCLFNLLKDPCEQQNLASAHPDILTELQTDVLHYRRRSARPRNQPHDGRSDPALYNFTWTWWLDENNTVSILEQAQKKEPFYTALDLKAV